jgi:hypothetical protein
VTSVQARLGVVNLVAPLAALVRPGEVGDGNDEEAIIHNESACAQAQKNEEMSND